MKMKILGFLVCVLIIAPISLSATPATTEGPEPANRQVVTITRPAAGNLYILDVIVIPRGGATTTILGPITLQATAQPNVAAVNWMVYDKNGNAWHPDIYPPTQPPNFQLRYYTIHRLISIILAGGPQAVITAIAVDSNGNTLGTDTINVNKFF